MQARVLTDDGERSERFDATQGLGQGWVLSPLLCNMFFARVLHVVLVPFSEDEGIVQNLVDLDDDGADRVEEMLTFVRRALWGMLYADNEGIVSRSAEELAKMTTVIVTVFEAAGLMVPGKKKRREAMMLQTRDLPPRALPFVIEAAGQRYQQTIQLLYLGGVIHEDADLMVEIKRQVQLMRACYKWFGPDLYHMTNARLSLKVPPAEGQGGRDPVAQVCPVDPRRDSLRRAPKGAPRSPSASPWLSESCGPRQPFSLVPQALKNTEIKIIETIIWKQHLFFAGAMVWRNKGRCPSRMVFAHIIGGENPALATEQLAQDPDRRPRRFSTNQRFRYGRFLTTA